MPNHQALFWPYFLFFDPFGLTDFRDADIRSDLQIHLSVQLGSFYPTRSKLGRFSLVYKLAHYEICAPKLKLCEYMTEFTFKNGIIKRILRILHHQRSYYAIIYV